MTHRQAHLARAPAVAAQSSLMFEPCPCTDRACREVCFQNATSGGPVAVIHQRTHLTAVHTRLMFDPCPCDNPVCRPLCHQN